MLRTPYNVWVSTCVRDVVGKARQEWEQYVLDSFNTLRPSQNGHDFANDIFKGIFVNENAEISIKISLKFVPKGPITNISALVQIMAWRRLGDKPLSEPMVISLLTHICVTRPQWVISLTAFLDISFSNTIQWLVPRVFQWIQPSQDLVDDKSTGLL